ncbi:DUF1361 domain-containing protein [Salisediminibacterium halotolerans]|uniref:Uncharacterized membrane protein n=1 Tax=Salisediminibacterium halotolerans TaxID=517425 RepID=A0A1H9WGZ9_9BACI|nr:DUF1361 domain-containing protein [Salisediminibacterium haloalkalitolerans]SES33222.1 Uncharacterized membrane protein [Salisediminibacterium haloalkalitolerans]
MELRYFTALLIGASFFISIWMLLFNRSAIDPLAWNLFLAWVPFFFALAAHWTWTTAVPLHGRAAIAMIFTAAWLFFFPNAVYILTDFLHLSELNFHLSEPDTTPAIGYSTTVYAMDRQAWNSFFTIAYVAGIGLAISVLSLYIMHFNVTRQFNTLIGWLFVLTVQILSGVGIFLGRFIRFNSWDILRDPLNVLAVTFESVDRFMIYFAGGFTLLGMFSYLFFYTAARLMHAK